MPDFGRRRRFAGAKSRLVALVTTVTVFEPNVKHGGLKANCILIFQIAG